MSVANVLFFLRPHTPCAHEALANSHNEPLLVQHPETGELLLGVGHYKSVSGKKHVLAVLGRGKDVDIKIKPRSIAMEQCTIELDDKESVVMLHDRSRRQTTQVSGGDAQPFELGRVRRVLLHNEFNNRITMGGTQGQLVEFELVWQRDPMDVMARDHQASPPPELSEPDCLAPTEEPSQWMTRIHTAGQGKGDQHFKVTNGELGRGSHGVVYETVDIYTGRRMAVKTIQMRPLLLDPMRHCEVKREIEALHRLQHPRIVEFLGCQESDEEIEIFMGLEDGTLSSLAGIQRPDAAQTRTILFVQMLEALEHLHLRRVIHRDVKPDNIIYKALPGGRYRFLLADFGVCNSQTHARTSSGTPIYMAPEVYCEQRQTSNADIWSLFVTMLWVQETEDFRRWSGQCPDYEERFKKIQWIAANNSDIQPIRDMAIEDPSARPSAADMRRMMSGWGLQNNPMSSTQNPAPEAAEPAFTTGLAGQPLMSGGLGSILPEATRPEIVNAAADRDAAYEADLPLPGRLRSRATQGTEHRGIIHDLNILRAGGSQPERPSRPAPSHNARPQATRVTRSSRPEEQVDTPMPDYGPED